MEKGLNTQNSTNSVGEVVSISGPVATCRVNRDVQDLMMNEIVFVGEERLFGEITRLEDDTATIQVSDEA